ncbi:MAG: GNAT family N-acetyltransferase, partial [bacterium]|nr:GNAT family N-acetyltransferase [bacterium]
RFAIGRYRNWSRQVPDAAPRGRAAQMHELQGNYQIDEVDRRFPGSRLRLYAETVLRSLADTARTTLEQAIRQLMEGGDIKEVLGRLYRQLGQKLPSPDLEYFLSRAAYPHLDLDEKAELVTTAEVGIDRVELVTEHTDRTGRTLRIRPVANTREVDTLHRIFYAGGMGGGLTSAEQLWVVVGEADLVIGGLGFIRRTPRHVVLDRIAVVQRCRGRGIGRVLMNEFVRRLAAEEVAIISAQLIRRHWLEQFGFKSHSRYAGVVLTLTDV